MDNFFNFFILFGLSISCPIVCVVQGKHRMRQVCVAAVSNPLNLSKSTFEEKCPVEEIVRELNFRVAKFFFQPDTLVSVSVVHHHTVISSFQMLESVAKGVTNDDIQAEIEDLQQQNGYLTGEVQELLNEREKSA